MNLLAGLYRPTQGSILTPFKKRDIFKHVGFVMQNPNYQLFMPTVKAEFEFQAKSRDFMEELIEIMDLGTLLDRHPQSLSEGQKRRVGVAAILSMEPDILLMDEPSVGQDKASMERMLEAIKALSMKKELTTIVISHDERCDFALGDRALNIVEGRLSS